MIFSLYRLAFAVIFHSCFYIQSFNSSISSNVCSDSALISTTVNKSVLGENPIMTPQNVIFEVKHNKSTNVVVYQANKTSGNLLNTTKPIDVFWLMRTKGNKIESLNTLEWRLAFGYKSKTVINGKKYTITLNALENKVITICQNETGKVEAFMTINGVYSKLTGVFFNFEYSFYLPDVKYVEFSGTAIDSNKVLVERING